MRPVLLVDHGAVPNRFYQHCAQTDRLHNSFDQSSLPTIWDRLAERGISARYYFSDAPFLALRGAKYLPISRPISAFLFDCVRGKLPRVSFVEPRFIEESTGMSNDDHPHADVRDGQAFLNRVYEAAVRSPNWKQTVLFINYDEWGGFFEHVAPPTAPIPPADQAAGNLDGLLGFRVPCIIVSPFARRAHVAHGVYDHTSILKMIEWRWDLEPLTVRDAGANNIAEALDFTANTRRALFKVPEGPFAEFCPPSEVDKWSVLLDLARGSFGWPI